MKKYYFEKTYKEETIETFEVEAVSAEEAEQLVLDYLVEPIKHETIESEMTDFYQTNGDGNKIKKEEPRGIILDP